MYNQTDVCIHLDVSLNYFDDSNLTTEILFAIHLVAQNKVSMTFAWQTES